MTQRERQTPDGGGQASPRLGADVPGANGTTEWWEDLFRAMPVSRRQELLALAGSQGLLYAHQIGPAAHASMQDDLHVCAPLSGEVSFPSGVLLTVVADTCQLVRPDLS